MDKNAGHGLILAPKLFYFSWFMAQGALMPFIGLYYRGVGLDLAQIGLLVSLSGLIQIVATPLWGVLADALRLRRVLLPLALACSVVPVFLIGQSSSFSILLVLVASLAVFIAPVAALADSATLALLGAARERYGRQRVWGAVGWIVSSLTFGFVLQRSGMSVLFISYVVFGLATAAVALAMPRARLPQADLRAATRTLLRDRRWAFFLSCVLLLGCGNAIIQGFLSLYLQDLGAGGDEIGFAIALGSLTELPVMVFAPLVLRRWGARPLMISSGLLFAVRAAVYVLAPSFGWALAAQLLHGPCFAGLWTGGVDEAQRLAPPGLETTAQSLFGTMLFGIAGALATAIGGRIYRDYGSATLFTIAGAAALLGVAGLLLTMVNREQPALSALEERG